ncbi:uncharacterized protein BDV14DRAFT_204021 [Aspergillus stella-maris]|uniref:uncharacterized protein n=1 Tax=Aspergillus stella-maris TaxID=1810926 RepID=UPI003CCD8392
MNVPDFKNNTVNGNGQECRGSNTPGDQDTTVPWDGEVAGLAPESGQECVYSSKFDTKTDNSKRDEPRRCRGSTPNTSPMALAVIAPSVLPKDKNGCSWVSFRYTRYELELEYIIRADVEFINLDDLSNDFKAENCIYPEVYMGENQNEISTEDVRFKEACNGIGWALAKLNPLLRGHAGILQRAVETWIYASRSVHVQKAHGKRMAKV